MKHTKINKFAWSVVLVLLLLLSLAAGVLGMLRFAVLQPAYYVKSICTVQTVQQISEKVHSDLQLQSNRYAFAYGYLEGTVSDLSLETCARDYLQRFFETALTGGDTAAVKASFDGRDAILTAVRSYAAQNPDSIYAADDENCVLLTDVLVGMVESDIGVLSHQKASGILQKGASYLSLLQKLAGFAVPVLLAWCVLALLAVVWIVISRSRARFYALSLGMLCVSEVFWIPLCVLARSGIMQGLVLSPGILRGYIQGVWDGLVTAHTVRFGIMCAVWLVLFAVSVGLLVRGRRAGKTTATPDKQAEAPDAAAAQIPADGTTAKNA